MRKYRQELESLSLRLSLTVAACVAVGILALGSSAAAADTLDSLRRQGKWDEVVLLLRARVSPELRVGPGFQHDLLELGDALFMSQRREEAVRYLLSAAESAKPVEWRDALLRKAAVLGRQFYANVAFQVFEEGNQAIRVGKPAVALERYAQVLTTERDQVEALLRQGQLKALARDYDSASEILQHVTRLLPTDISAYSDEANLWLAHVLLERGERERARDLIRDVNVVPRKAADYLITYLLNGDRRDRKLAELALASEQKSARSVSEILYAQLAVELMTQSSDKEKN